MAGFHAWSMADASENEAWARSAYHCHFLVRDPAKHNRSQQKMEKEGLLGCIMSQIIRTRKTKGQTTFMPKSASQLKIIHKGSINASQAS